MASATYGVACRAGAWEGGGMANERDEEQASVDSALEREMQHEEVRSAKAKQDRIEKTTREDHLDEG